MSNGSEHIPERPVRHGGEAGLCESEHYCTACRWGGCVLGEACEDLHQGECCSLTVACECEPCVAEANRRFAQEMAQ